MSNNEAYPEVQENKLRPFQKYLQQPFQYGHQWVGWHCTILLSIKSTYINISKEININNVSFIKSSRYRSRQINRPTQGWRSVWLFASSLNFSRVDVTTAWLQQVQCGLNELIGDSSRHCCTLYTIKTFKHVVVDSNVITLASSNIPSAEEEKEWNYGGVMEVDVRVLCCADWRHSAISSIPYVPLEELLEPSMWLTFTHALEENYGMFLFFFLWLLF